MKPDVLDEPHLDAARALGIEQGHDLPIDSHLHTDLSPDSNVPIDVFAEQAIERRIPEIAITDHVDFDPRVPAFSFAPFEQRERVAREAAERWADRGLAIRFGVEISWESAYEAEIREHLTRHRYDFVIGSVHIGPDSPYRRERVAGWVEGRRVDEVIEPYFAEVLAAARSGVFDTLGHLDFAKRFLAPHLPAARLAEAPELYEPLLRALVESGTGLEVNTSGLRQPPRETYPSPAVVARFRALGGRHVTVGSDAHRADSFAFGLRDGYRAAARAGFDEVAFRRGGERVSITMPRDL